VLSQRTVSKLEALLVRLCIRLPSYFHTPAVLDNGLIYRHLYEQEVDSQLLAYLGQKYDYDPKVFVRAIHEGYDIQQFAVARNLFPMTREEAVEYADIILLMVGALALKKVTEVGNAMGVAEARNFIRDELSGFIASARSDGFSFHDGEFYDSAGKPVNAKRLWDLSKLKVQGDHNLAVAAATAATIQQRVQVAEVQKSTEPTPTTQSPTIPTPSSQLTYARSGSSLLTIVGIIVAFLALVASVTVPEIRHWLGLDKAKPQMTTPANPTTPQSISQPSSSQNEKTALGSSAPNSEPQKQKEAGKGTPKAQ